MKNKSSKGCPAGTHGQPLASSTRGSVRFPGLSRMWLEHTCFLTQIGGGVFSNPPQIIAPAIAENVELIAESGIDVNVVCFNSESFFANYPLLESAIKRTGGKVITTEKK